MSANYTYNKASQISITVMISMLVAIDVIGNTLVILIILTNKSMKSSTNYLLLNLAVADICFGLFAAPRFISGHFVLPVGLAGNIICIFLTSGNISWIGGAASSFTLVAICFERYIAIMHPYNLKQKLSLRRVKSIVLGSWIFAVVLNLPLVLTVYYDKQINTCVEEWPEQQMWLGLAYSSVWFVFTGCIPITIMIFLYSRVIYTLWFKHPESKSKNTQLALLKSRKKVTKMVVIVSVIYAVCWLPDSLIYLLSNYEKQYNYAVDVASQCTIVLITGNSAINPFIYALQSETFRQHLKKLVCCRTFRRNRVTRQIKEDHDRTLYRTNTNQKKRLH